MYLDAVLFRERYGREGEQYADLAALIMTALLVDAFGMYA